MRRAHAPSSVPPPAPMIGLGGEVALESLPVPALVIDARGAVRGWNRAAEVLTGGSHTFAGADVVEVLGREVLWVSGARPGDACCFPVQVLLAGGGRRPVMAWASMTGDRVGEAGAIILLTPPAGADQREATPRVCNWRDVAEQISRIDGDRVGIAIGLIGLGDVNDGFSRSTGDAVLTAIHARLMAVSPPKSVVERISGARFAVICSAAGVDCPELLATTMIDAARRPIDTPLGRVAIGAAAGVDLGNAESGLIVVERLNRKASEAARRGSGVVISDARRPTHDELQGRAARSSADLFESVSRGDISAWFQPVVELGGGRVAEIEAFARWGHVDNRHPDSAAFVGPAQLTGMIVEIGAIIVADTIAAVAELRRTPQHRALVGSVNVSTTELARVGYADSLHRRLTEAGLPPEALRIEIPAESCVSNLELVRAEIERLRRYGIGVTLDHALNSFPIPVAVRCGIDVVKLHPSAISGSPDVDIRLLRSMIRTADALGVALVATGIETERDHVLAHRAGFSHAQGHFYGSPRPWSEMVSGELDRPWPGLGQGVSRRRSTHVARHPRCRPGAIVRRRSPGRPAGPTADDQPG